MKAKVTITLKPGLLDAQGRTIKSALEALGFRGVKDVRMGKYLEVELNGSSPASVKREVERMCQKLLANPMIEQYRVEIARGSRLEGTPRASSLQPRARAKRA